MVNALLAPRGAPLQRFAVRLTALKLRWPPCAGNTYGTVGGITGLSTSNKVFGVFNAMGGEQQGGVLS